jgi:hypothetical protein
MNSLATEGIAEPLLFTWDSPHRPRAVLMVFLVLSLVAHALCFYLFQIVYPRPVAFLPQPARITFISPDSEQGRTLLRWIDAEDPASAFTTQPPPTARLGALAKAEHVPSYSALEPIVKDIPPLRPDLRIPSAHPPGAVHSGWRKSASAIGKVETSISFSKELDQFGAPILPASTFSASNEETPEALRFRVAVNEFGEIQYCFPINSSGDPALDEQVLFQVVRSRFSPKKRNGGNPGSSLVWGIATVQWDSDVAHSQQAATATLTP